MSSVGVDGGFSPRVFDTTTGTLSNEMWWATETPPGHGFYKISDPEFDASIQKPDMATFEASLQANAQAWFSALGPNKREAIFRSSQAQKPL